MLLMGMEIPLWLALTGGAAGLAVVYRMMRPDPYRHAGLKGPTSYPLIGNLMSLMNVTVPMLDVEWRKKYGKLVLTYDGSSPNIMVYDPEFIRAVFVKQFDKLTNRRPFAGGGSIDSGIQNTTDEHWRHVRAAISPTFTSGKLKKMLPRIQNCCNRLVEALKEKENSPVDIRKVMSAYTIEVIGSTAFGIDVDCQRDPSNPFLVNALAFVGQFERTDTSFKTKATQTMVLMAFLMLPPKLLSKILKITGTSLLDRESNNYFEALSAKMIADNKGEGREDFIKSVSNQIIVPDKDDPDTRYNEYGAAWTKKGLTEEDVKGNAIIFIFAGYQTTADTSHFALYELAMHPDIQNRLREEVLENCTTEDVTYDQLQKLDYTESCINEALRLYPIAVRFDRLVSEDFEYNGVVYKKGSYISVGSMAIHRDPEYWENPEDFDPDRWSPERSEGRHPCAFVPFGYGPRACIGMRLAILEMKIAMVFIVRNFEIKKTPKTPSRPLEIRVGFTMLPKEDIELEFQPLN